MVRMSILLVLLTGPALIAQDSRIQPTAIVKGQSLEMQKLIVTNQVRSSAAAIQLAALELSLSELLGEFENEYTGVSDDDAALRRHAEDEVLRAIAAQFEQFLATYEGTPEAEAARAVLARIWVRLGHTEEAAAVLREFDAEAAATNDVLHAALAVTEIKAIADSVPTWLLALVEREDAPIVVCFDALYVALRLGNAPLAGTLLEKIEAKAKSFEAKAEFLLAEAELAARFAKPRPLPIDEPKPTTGFVVDPTPAIGLVHPGTPAGTGFTDASGPRAADLGPEPKLERGFATGPVFRAIKEDAQPGFADIQARLRAGVKPDLLPIGPDFTKATSPELLPPDDIVICILHRVVHEYAGTQAAELAAARLYTSAVHADPRPVSFELKTTDGVPIVIGNPTPKPVLIVFFSLAVPKSIEEVKALAAMHRALVDPTWDAIAISLDTPQDAWLVEAAAERYGIAWPIAIAGPHSAVARGFGVDALPKSVLLDQTGGVCELAPNRLMPGRLDEAIVASVPVPVPGQAKLVEPTPLPSPSIAKVPYAGPGILPVLSRVAAGYEVAVELLASPEHRLVSDRIEREKHGTKVFVSLIAPEKYADDLQPRVVRVPVGADPGPKVWIFVRHMIAGAQYFDEPTWQLAAELDSPISARQGYSGPAVEARLVKDDSAPTYRIVLHKPSPLPVPDYTIEVIGVRHVKFAAEEFTQVLARVIPIAVPSPLSAQLPDQPISVDLGPSVGTKIDIVIDYRPKLGGEADWAIAKSLGTR